MVLLLRSDNFGMKKKRKTILSKAIYINQIYISCKYSFFSFFKIEKALYKLNMGKAEKGLVTDILQRAKKRCELSIRKGKGERSFLQVSKGTIIIIMERGQKEKQPFCTSAVTHLSNSVFILKAFSQTCIHFIISYSVQVTPYSPLQYKTYIPSTSYSITMRKEKKPKNDCHKPNPRFHFFDPKQK